MKTRAKFFVANRNERSHAPSAGDTTVWAEVILNAVYSPDPDTENNKFWTASPSGKMRLDKRSEECQEFQPGAFFFIDVEPSVEGNFVLSQYAANPYGINIRLTDDKGSYLEIGISNMAVKPIFHNKVEERYQVTLIPTTKEG